MKVIVVDCGSNKVSQIEQELSACECSVEKVVLSQANQFNFDKFDALVISGGPKLFTDEAQCEILMRQFAFIKSLRKPILGICLGHQAIALTYGAKIFLGAVRRAEETLSVTQAHSLLNDLPDSFIVIEDHCEGVSLPDGFVQLASSESYQVEVMACDAKHLYGVQFHPEVSPKTGAQIFANFCALVRQSLR